MVLCFEPGFDPKVLEQNGYNADTYYRGSMDQKSFVGWNGGENENKSSKDILEEVLATKGQLLNESTFVQAYFTEDYDNWVPAEVKMRTLAYPIGRCLSISYPPSHKNLHTLYVGFNKTAFHFSKVTSDQGCIIRSILPSGMGARGVSSEHVENMEMFSCSPT